MIHAHDQDTQAVQAQDPRLRLIQRAQQPVGP